MGGRDDQLGRGFKIHPAPLPHAAIIGAAGGLHEAAAAIAKAVVRLNIAERLRLARIAEAINPLGNGGLVVGKRMRLRLGDAGGVLACAEHLAKARAL